MDINRSFVERFLNEKISGQALDELYVFYILYPPIHTECLAKVDCTFLSSYSIGIEYHIYSESNYCNIAFNWFCEIFIKIQVLLLFVRREITTNETLYYNDSI